MLVSPGTSGIPTSTTGADEHKGCSCHSYGIAGSEGMIGGQTGCQNCHTGAHAAHGFATPAASGHNTTTFGTVGAKVEFNGSEGVTLHTINETSGVEATLTTEWAFPTHAVFWGNPGTAGAVDTTAAAWVAAWNAANPTKRTAYESLDKDSVITCQDCHTGLNASGPHGAAQSWGIDPTYPGDYNEAELTKWIVTNPSGIKVRAYDAYMGTAFDSAGMIAANPSGIPLGSAPYYSGMPTTSVSVNKDGQNHAIICSKCHQLEIPGDGYMNERTPQAEPWMGDGTNGTTLGLPTYTNTGKINTANVGGSNVAHGNAHQDAAGGQAQCVNCHLAIPHAWKRPRLLVNAGPYPVGTGGGKDSTFDKVTDPAPYKSANMHGTVDNGSNTPGALYSTWGLYPTMTGAPRGMQSLAGNEEHELIASEYGTNLYAQTWVAPADEANLAGPYTLHINSVPPNGNQNTIPVLPITAKSNWSIDPQGHQGAVATATVDGTTQKGFLAPSAIAGYALYNQVCISGTPGADGSVYTATLASHPIANVNYVEWKEMQCEGCNHNAAHEAGMGIGATGTSTAITGGLTYSESVRVLE